MMKLAGAAVFFVALVVALLITKYYGPQQPAPPQPPPAPPDIVDNFPPPPPPPPPPTMTRQQITHKVQLVTLDMAARKSFTTLVLERDRNLPAPERVWVWTAFFVPNGARGQVYAGEPVLVEKPFASGERATVNATGACPWCGAPGAPTGGYYARVNVSTESATAARLDESAVSRDLSTATNVVVEEGRKRSR